MIEVKLGNTDLQLLVDTEAIQVISLFFHDFDIHSLHFSLDFELKGFAMVISLSFHDFDTLILLFRTYALS